jgi:hypothetical protein
MSVEFIENNELDDYFNCLAESFEQDEESEGVKELDWWLQEYPTLELAEAKLLEQANKLKELDKDDFSVFTDYLTECARLDHDVMMLEMTVDEHYKDWIPTGASISDFQVGETIFRSGGGRFLCTDVGTRTVIAIRYTPRTPENMDGPPYFLQEVVFDEFDIEGVDILS